MAKENIRNYEKNIEVIIFRNNEKVDDLPLRIKSLLQMTCATYPCSIIITLWQLLGVLRALSCNPLLVFYRGNFSNV